MIISQRCRSTIVPIDATTDWSSESETDLMSYMAMKDEDSDGAKLAWEEFYRRHVDYLYSVCYKAYLRILGSEDEICDLVTETFIRAYENAHSWKAEQITDRNRLRRRARAWLGRIAQRIILDLFRSNSPQMTPVDPDWFEHISQNPKADDKKNNLVQKIQDSFKTLNKKELTVIQITFQWYDVSKKNQRLPDDVIKDLASSLNTTTENLRQIRKRALQKIKNYIKQCENIEEISDE